MLNCYSNNVLTSIYVTVLLKLGKVQIIMVTSTFHDLLHNLSQYFVKTSSISLTRLVPGLLLQSECNLEP